jgi:acetolactate decarboxylase
MKKEIVIGILSVILINSCSTSTNNAEPTSDESSVKVVGAMKNVMHKGELFGTISLDTIQNKKGLYGLGPIEYLTGELFIIDGVTYKSTVVNDSTMKVEQTENVKAPFFVYTNVEEWVEVKIPATIGNLQELEHFLDRKTRDSIRPFAFRLEGQIEAATIHVVNLPKGTKVSSPEEAHQGLVPFELSKEFVEIVGFFSTEHKAIFTHHDTFMHLHLITKDKSQMGHLEELIFQGKKMKLYIQKQ